MLYCMNNLNRNAATIFAVPEAFFDLNTWDKQASQAAKLRSGMNLVVVTTAVGNRLQFEEWHYTHSVFRPDPNGRSVQVMCGRRTGQGEVLSREEADVKHPDVFRTIRGRRELKLGWSIVGEPE